MEKKMYEYNPGFMVDCQRCKAGAFVGESHNDGHVVIKLSDDNKPIIYCRNCKQEIEPPFIHNEGMEN